MKRVEVWEYDGKLFREKESIFAYKLYQKVLEKLDTGKIVLCVHNPFWKNDVLQICEVLFDYLDEITDEN